MRKKTALLIRKSSNDKDGKPNRRLYRLKKKMYNQFPRNIRYFIKLKMSEGK